MTAEFLFYICFYWMTQSPWGILIGVVLVFLVGTGITGLVDFRKRKKLPHSSQVAVETEDRDQRMQEISSYLKAEFAAEFEVSHFDGAYQVFAPADGAASDAELFRRLSLKFPATVFSVHHTAAANDGNELANH
jgi:hypothetical protein